MVVVRRRRVACSFSAESAQRIIVSLDGMAPDQALAFSAQVEGLRWVKVGLELFVQAGPEVVAQLRDQGLRTSFQSSLNQRLSAAPFSVLRTAIRTSSL